VKIPSCFYGTKEEAKKECDKVTRKILKGVPLLEAVADYEMIDTKEVPESCLIVCNPLGITDKSPHFYMTLIVDAIRGKFWTKHNGDRDTLERVFNQFIEHDWSILAFCEDTAWFYADSIRIQDRRHRWQPYLRKLCEFWSALLGEGKRYAGYGGDISALWSANCVLHYILGNMGVPKKDALTPRNPANLQELCEKYDLLTMDVINSPTVLAKHPYAN